MSADTFRKSEQCQICGRTGNPIYQEGYDRCLDPAFGPCGIARAAIRRIVLCEQHEPMSHERTSFVPFRRADEKQWESFGGTNDISIVTDRERIDDPVPDWVWEGPSRSVEERRVEYEYEWMMIARAEGRLVL